MLRLSSALRSTRAAFDLASVMVGVLVVGIIGGIVAAVIFGVIPWAQNNAAKGTLNSISTAENAYRGLEADQNANTGYGNKADLIAYADKDGKKTSLITSSSSYDVQAGTKNGDACWGAVVKSNSGAFLYGTNQHPGGKKANGFLDAQQSVSADCDVTFTAPTSSNEAANKCEAPVMAADGFTAAAGKSDINCQDATPVYISANGVNSQVGATVVSVGKDNNAYILTVTSAPNQSWGSNGTDNEPTITCLYWTENGGNQYSVNVPYYPSQQYSGACAATTMSPTSTVQVNLHAVALNTGSAAGVNKQFRILWTA